DHSANSPQQSHFGSDRAQLARMAKETKATLERTNVDVIADRGYFSSEEILECDKAGITNARASIPAEILVYIRAAYPQRRSSNANSLQGQNSAGFPQICAIRQGDNLRRHF